MVSVSNLTNKNKYGTLGASLPPPLCLDRADFIRAREWTAIPNTCIVGEGRSDVEREGI